MSFTRALLHAIDFDQSDAACRANPAHDGGKLKREVDTAAHHSKIVVGTAYHIPAEIVNDPDMRSQPNFQAGAELAKEAGMVACVLCTDEHFIGGGSGGKKQSCLSLLRRTPRRHLSMHKEQNGCVESGNER